MSTAPSAQLKLLKRLWPLLGGAVAMSGVIAAVVPAIGLNLLAESIGLCFGVFVIDVAFRQYEAERSRPVRQAAWLQASRFHGHIVRFINLVVENTWTVPDARSLWAAIDDGNLSGVAKMLEGVRFDAGEGIGDGRTAVRIHLSQATAAADRFMSRYIGIAEPELVASIERFETTWFSWMAERPTIPVNSVGAPVWMELFGIEDALRRLLTGADATDVPDLRLERLLPDVEEWLRPKPGWTEVVHQAVARPPKTPDAGSKRASS